MKKNSSKAVKTFDPVFRFIDFIDHCTHKSLAQIVSRADGNKFRSQRNASLTIDHHEEFGQYFFKQEPVQKLAAVITSDKFISQINNLLDQSNSMFSKGRQPYLEIDRKLFPKLQATCSSRLIAETNHWKIPINGFIPLRHHSCLQRNNKNPSFSSWYIGNIDDEILLKTSINYALAFGKIPIIPKMTFTRGYKGMFLPPHTDALDKLVAMMIYLPISDDQENCGLGTSFWVSKDERILAQIDPGILSEDQYREFILNHIRVKHPFCSGDLTVFFKSETTWHSFEYDINDIGPRCAILINYMVPKVLFQNLGVTVAYNHFAMLRKDQ